MNGVINKKLYGIASAEKWYDVLQFAKELGLRKYIIPQGYALHRFLKIQGLPVTCNTLQELEIDSVCKISSKKLMFELNNKCPKVNTFLDDKMI